MSKSTRTLSGPRRLILIQSGKYDYAEIDLSQSFQLVGVNGLGKTALISTLQYLYIDNQKDMRFGQHSTDESRRFYFRTDASFILFECETSLGTVTLGVRSQGPTSGYELQRFTWHGAYQKDDFINAEGQAKRWDEVRATLGGKDLKIIEGPDLRRLLGAIDGDTAESWGLVPLVEARDYARFRQTFQRLLQLRDIRQDDLKQLLADCAKLGPSQREIDLAKDFESDLGKIERDRAEVKRLENARPAVEEVRRLYDREFNARAIAHAYVKELNQRHAGYAGWFKATTDALYAVCEKARSDYDRLILERNKLQAAGRNAAAEAGKVESKLSVIRQARERFSQFIPEFEMQARDLLGDEVADLKSRLDNLPKESPELLSRQLETKREELRQREIAAARLSELFITWLRARMPEESVARLGAVLDRRILESVMNEQINVTDEAVLIARLKTAADRCDTRGYEDEAVTVEFPAGAISATSQIGRLDQLQEAIRELKRDIDRREREIETLKNAAPYRERLKAAQKEHADKIQLIAAYQAFQEEAVNEPSYLVERDKLANEVAEIERLQEKNEEARTKVQNEGEAALAKFKEVTADQDEIRRQATNMPTADGDDPGETPLSTAHVRDLPESLLEVFKIVRAKCSEARGLSQALSDKVGLLDRDFLNASFPYNSSAPVEDRLRVLETQIASLPERSQNIENRWSAVLSDAKRCFHTLLKSLEAVQKEVRKLNAELAGIEFSSIANVRLEVLPNAAAVSEYERHASDASQPSLFDTVEEADRKLIQFRRLLERRPRLSLNELFSLRCEVIRKDGQKNFYDDFDAVESTGTTIVLKVTLNLLVLRDLLIEGKARLPFYLDEVHALDRQNFGNILQLSERLGFVGIYAAPTSAIGPRRFVHLVPDTRGRLVVTSAHQKDIVRAPGDQTPLANE
jgi:hypothetical protein